MLTWVEDEPKVPELTTSSRTAAPPAQRSPALGALVAGVGEGAAPMRPPPWRWGRTRGRDRVLMQPFFEFTQAKESNFHSSCARLFLVLSTILSSKSSLERKARKQINIISLC